MDGRFLQIVKLAEQIEAIAQNAMHSEQRDGRPHYLEKKALYTIDSIGVTLGVSAKRLNQFLIQKDWIYRVGRVYSPTYKIRPFKYCDYQTVEYRGRDGGLRIREHLKWTEAGRKAIIRLYLESTGALF
jgi:phage antirepressor YoqD-like protein